MQYLLALGYWAAKNNVHFHQRLNSSKSSAWVQFEKGKWYGQVIVWETGEADVEILADCIATHTCYTINLTKPSQVHDLVDHILAEVTANAE